jgi:hypothetical protein
MPARPATPRRWTRGRPSLEALEARSLPSLTPWPGLSAPHVGAAGATLSAAYLFPAVTAPGVREEAVGTITNSAAGGGNADWYEFELPAAADLTLTTPPGRGAGLVTPVLSLFNTAPIDGADLTQNDPYTPTGHRLLAQDDGAAHGGVATIEQVLAPGTYYVAVTGSSDHDFSPFLAGSGETGGTGAYGLLITAAPLAHPAAGPGPAVIATTPADGALLASSPFALYLELNSPLDPSTVLPGTNIVLNDLTAGVPVPLQQNAANPADPTNGAVYNSVCYELAVFPEAPLAPGDVYQLQLVGDPTEGPQVIAGPDGTPLGSGQDFFLTFQVTGVKGVPGAATAFNTIATALPLNLTPGGELAQLYGAIGNDPFALGQTGSAVNDVDLYHFTISGTDGHYAFLAAAEAGRIGSPLQPALALFEDTGGVVTLVAGDIGTGNQAPGSDGSQPLRDDAVLYAGLTPGDYYLAVGAAYDLPDPALAFGTPYVPGVYTGLFDPTAAYSAGNGSSTGPYLLTTSLTRDDTAPRVTEVDGLSAPGAPPTFITVQFDKPVTLRQLGYQDQPGDASTVGAVWVHASNGADYHPRLLSYDGATNVATFYMLDAVPAGPAALYLAAVAPDGSPGVTDLAGNPLAGSDAGGDLVIPFTAGGPPRVIDPVTGHLTFESQGFGTSLQQPQVIGPLFPDELGADAQGVNHATDLTGTVAPDIVGPTTAPATEYYEIQLLQDRNYGFTLTAAAPARLEIFTADGHEITNLDSGPIYNFHLKPGTYIVAVGPADPSVSGTLPYVLTVTLGGSFENAVALTVGAAPPYAIAPQRAAAPPTPAVVPPTQLSLTTAPAAGAAPATTTTTTPAAGFAITLALPSGTLITLSAPPVGGERGATPPAPGGPDRLVLTETAPPSAEGTVRFALLTDGDAPTIAASTGAGAGAVLPNRAAELLRLLEQVAIDLLFRGGVGQWLRDLTIPSTPPPVPVPDDAGAEEPAPADEGAAADWVWAGGLLAAAGLAVAPEITVRLAAVRRTAVLRTAAKRSATDD